VCLVLIAGIRSLW